MTAAETAHEPDWLTVTRRAAASRFAELGVPTEAEEIWRYSRIDHLDLDRYTTPEAAPAADAGAPESVADLLAALDGAQPEPVVVVSRDGRPEIPPTLPPGIEVARPGAQDWGLGRAVRGEDAFVALNAARAPVPLRISADATAPAGVTVVVVHLALADGAVSFPRLLVHVAPQAELRVIEVVASPDIESLVVPVTELDVERGGRLAYVNVGLLGPRAWQVAHQASRLAADATLTSATVAFGGNYARVRTDATAAGAGATSRLLAVWFGAGDQMHDLRTVQAHEAPQTTSELVFKGAVANRSHSVYSGVIRVEKGARATNATQTNRNLVLDEGAHADSVPNLEIEDNDVRCSHASAVGPVDPDQRFYLESRGVPTGEADRLIAQGFLDEVIERIPAPELSGWLRRQVTAKLAEAEARR